MATIAKYFEVNLDTKITKPLKDKSFICFDTDSIIIKAFITEDFENKILEDSQILIIYDYGSYRVEQAMGDGGIEIIGENEVLITPKTNCLVESQSVKITINIYDEDEFITAQPFTFKVLKSSESSLVDEAEDAINTTIALNDKIDMLEDRVDAINVDISDKTAIIQGQIDGFSTSLEGQIESMYDLIDANIENSRNNITQLNSEMEELINGEIETTRTEIENLKNDAIEDINELAEKTNNTAIELDECFLRSTSLMKMESGNYISFISDYFVQSIGDMLNRSFIVHVVGSPYNADIITPTIGILYFFKDTRGINIAFNTLITKTIQGNSVNVNVKFGDGTTVLDPSENIFRILVETNISKNYVDTANCIINSNMSLGE